MVLFSINILYIVALIVVVFGVDMMEGVVWLIIR